jgi:hypothetical protein
MKTAKTISDQKFTFPLKFLSFVQHSMQYDTKATDGEEDGPDILSWVPDWRKPLIARTLLFRDFPARTGLDYPSRIIFPAAAYGGQVHRTIIDKSSVEHNLAQDRLEVRGVRILKIMEVAACDAQRRSASILEIFNIFSDPYPTTALSYLQVSREGLDPKRKSLELHSPSPRAVDFWDYVHECEQKGRHIRPLPLHLRYSSKDLNLSAWHETDDLETIAQGRKLISTTIGFMGLAPIANAIGDEICVLFGGNVPYVIRRKGIYWTFIGECYV